MAIERPSDDEIKAIEAGEQHPLKGSHDGLGSGDHDLPYKFGRKPNTQAPFPFTPRQYAKLLITRGEAQEADHPNLKRFKTPKKV